MGKKNKGENQRLAEENQANGNKKQEEIEGKFLLGKPKFKKLDNGRYKCVQTGHELLGEARESYAHTKHCRIGLIDFALARNKPPLNMFREDPLSSSRLICKLTGHTVNKTEEHIWKHINGKRFLNMLEKEEAEAKVGKEASVGVLEEEAERKPEKSVEGSDGLKKKKKNKKKKKHTEEDFSKITMEAKSLEDNNGDMEENEFWMPPVGERWDFDDGKDRWGSGSESESESDPETHDSKEATDIAGEESINDTGELPNTTKRMHVEVEPSDITPSKKKKKKKIRST